ncbi:MAG: CRISPR-associated endonuclease Cas3'', partial [Syntrophomonas sp.]
MHGKVCSHPGKNLEEHLLNVLEWAEELAEFYALPLSDQEKTAIALHDIGKAAVLFQGKLCPNCPERSNCPNPYPRVKGKSYGHAEPSSFIVLARTDSIICAEAVRRHHTGLQDLQEIKNFWADTGIDEQKGQVSSLFWWDGASTLYKCIGIKAGKWAEILTRTEDSWQDFYFNSIESEYSRDNVQQISQTWVDIRKLSSLLVTSDRWDAMVGTGFLLSKESWDKASFDDYLASLKPNELSPWRASISQMVYISANEKLASPGIYTITLPTGAGKTIIGLETAVQAAHRFKATGIIYVLPFISLVDQNAKVAGEIFEKIQEDHSLAYTDTSAQ